MGNKKPLAALWVKCKCGCYDKSGNMSRKDQFRYIVSIIQKDQNINEDVTIELSDDS